MYRSPDSAVDDDRLLTPLGGLVLTLTLSLVAFWLPLLEIVSRRW